MHNLKVLPPESISTTCNHSISEPEVVLLKEVDENGCSGTCTTCGITYFSSHYYDHEKVVL